MICKSFNSGCYTLSDCAIFTFIGSLVDTLQILKARLFKFKIQILGLQKKKILRLKKILLDVGSFIAVAIFLHQGYLLFISYICV